MRADSKQPLVLLHILGFTAERSPINDYNSMRMLSACYFPFFLRCSFNGLHNVLCLRLTVDTTGYGLISDSDLGAFSGNFHCAHLPVDIEEWFGFNAINHCSAELPADCCFRLDSLMLNVFPTALH